MQLSRDQEMLRWSWCLHIAISHAELLVAFPQSSLYNFHISDIIFKNWRQSEAKGKSDIIWKRMYYIILPRIFTVTVCLQDLLIYSQNCLHVACMNSLKAKRWVQVSRQSFRDYDTRNKGSSKVVLNPLSMIQETLKSQENGALIILLLQSV